MDWKIITKRWREATIVVLLFVIIIMRSCQPNAIDRPEIPPIVIESSTYKPSISNEDNTLYLKFIETKTLDPIHDTVFITESGDVDTAAILKDWLTKRAYNDTLVNNDSALIIVNDELWKNKIQKRNFTLTLYPQPVLVPEKRLKVFLGFGANGWMDKFGVHGSVAMLTKRDQLYSLSYDPINKRVDLTVYWKLSFRKNR